MRVIKKSTLVYLFIMIPSIIITAIYIGNRDSSVGADTIAYDRMFKTGLACKCILQESEIGFQLFLYPLYLLQIQPNYIFSIISIFIFCLLFIISKKFVDSFININILSSNYYKYYLALFGILNFMPFLLQAHINAIRQGLSALILLVSFLYYIENRRLSAYTLLFIAITFHTSTILIAPFLVIFLYSNKFNLNINFFIVTVVFTFLALLYSFGITEEIVFIFSEFSGFPLWTTIYEYGLSADYRRGVRLDFILFTLIFLIPLFIYSQKNQAFRKYLIFIMASTIPFLLLGWGSYSNRYLLPSWFYIFFGVGVYLLNRFRYLSKFYIFLVLTSLTYNILRVIVNPT